ncbi:RNA polymerase-associated protein RapA [Candidatus Methylospira mobilis]|uniref:RNA polymerase-associated protein RapA n=1 Tax=Candidatus Methylospira mobilis TaxID=1808979 RepID=A0A5Q0BFI5_9GAMM|nr:RNA polymerase-associated protein RapA [Candidatus Methylospira mobilis]QFY41892.1 RNA polymerase-associated protein RapA [Candidatus Methylospira mobilis]WNV06771.1 RNA polymerase-associated protein RapA [Candidatus Methylospira mobilis]
MPTFIPGQRWISETEPELGLGMVLEATRARVTVLFIASNERRTYAADNAPLNRVRFVVGDTIESADGWQICVSRIQEQAGLITYIGADLKNKPRELEETELSHNIQFNRPQDRLFSGQIDTSEQFKLRCRTRDALIALEQSPIRGLAGARAGLIPHQLYIAHEVAGRHAPRVLLADEVGLGKTIEACLIAHHQILSGRAERVLILVPEPLLHQWLVELRRRFNLNFSLYDEERYWQTPEGNPFLSEQWILTSLTLFSAEPERKAMLLGAGWDLCIVDEAHHLDWSPETPGEDYLLVEQLARKTPGLLLLTATPEQFGKENHFARMKLLDPDRFSSYEAFIAEEANYIPLARLIERLTATTAPDEKTREQLRGTLCHDRAEQLIAGLDDPETNEQSRDELVRLLLDRHGTGRILFRNTRATVKGFPARQPKPYPLTLPDAYKTDTDTTLAALLHPETSYRTLQDSDTPWWKVDPRVNWLCKLLSELRPAKILVICATQATAMELDAAINRLTTVGSTIFHEGMSIMERDRAAAWFADEEDGAQVLVCSEIGSEGRNFQFAHHLVLFDLPLNPELLEQRIGRLDRIGQTSAIQLHIPYLRQSAQETLFRWYHEGLDAFTHHGQASMEVYDRLSAELHQTLLAPVRQEKLEALLARTRKLRDEVLTRLHDGRDRLLEFNSCRSHAAETLADAIRAQDEDNNLWPWLESVFEVYGVNVEEHSEHCHILLPGDHMPISRFPELPEEGVTATRNRETALAREDMIFLTWEHPMVRGAIDLILGSEQGNAAFALVQHEDLEPGQLLLDAVYLLECAAPKRLQAYRHMPQTLVRVLVDSEAGVINDLPPEDLIEIPRRPDREALGQMFQAQRKAIETMIRLSEKTAKNAMPSMVAIALKTMLDEATAELQRLAALKKVNPSVRQDELDKLKADTLETHGHIQATRLRLDALRILLAV